METKTNNDYTRRNRFTGQSIELTEEEANRHDAIFYHEALATLEDKDMDDPGISKPVSYTHLTLPTSDLV